VTVRLLASAWILGSFLWGQQTIPGWKDEVRKCADKHDWGGAMEIIDREISQAHQDVDVKFWRARILFWSGKLEEAEREYREIVIAVPNDPDYWLGLSAVYSHEGRSREAEETVNRALALDARRADIHLARARALRDLQNFEEAKLEFQKTLELDPTSREARQGLHSLKADPKHEFSLGTNTDLFSFAGPNYQQQMQLSSQWTPAWKTATTGTFYRWGGIDAEKFGFSVTGKVPRAGALELGGATAKDNAIIPKKEVFLAYDGGWKLAWSKWVPGVEALAGQHWYWYTTARIFTVQEMAILYLPADWTWSFGVIEARSEFFGIGTQWRPSEVTRVGFPIARREGQRLSGNVVFALGTENFAQVEQIGAFSSKTYGGCLRLQLSTRQNIASTLLYQKQTRDRTETSFGFTYGIRF